MESNTQKFTNDFQKSLKFTLKWEGGYVNDPDDPGGETKWGISKRAYPTEDILNLTPERAASLYHRDYWLLSGCDKLPFPYSTVVFDTAVNLGVTRTRNLHEKIHRAGDEVDLSARLLEARKQHYISIINKNTRLMKYLNGWLNRLNDLKKFVEVSTSPAS